MSVYYTEQSEPSAETARPEALWRHPLTRASLKRWLPSLASLVVLVVALGCLVFLFNLFGELQSASNPGLLGRSDASATTTEVFSGARITAMAACLLSLTLAGGTAWLWWSRMKGLRARRLLAGMLSALGVVAFFGLALYLGASAATLGSLPFGNLPYDHHQIALTDIEPLGLTLLAAFILSVAVVGIVRPKLVIIPALVWLVLAYALGMFGSAAISGLNLFDRPLKSQPVLAYQETVRRYAPTVANPIAAESAHLDATPLTTGPSDQDTETSLIQALGSLDTGIKESAAASLAELGAEVIGLETGGFLVQWDRSVYLVPGVTTEQTAPPQPETVFSVSGATETGYLRTAIGDAYSAGAWDQINLSKLPYSTSGDVRSLVADALMNFSGKIAGPPPQPESMLLSHNQIAPYHADRDQEIAVASHIPGGSLIGPLPVALNLESVSVDGSYSPFSGTFDAEVAQDYSWISRAPEFSQEQLRQATPTSDAAYVALPANLPSRVRDLARRVTAEYDSPYLKARAIENFLLREYVYGFTDSQTAERPMDQDPIDWFLFDSREGTSGQFSSAFVVMARSVGIPARVASGWAIAEVGVQQTVSSDQAHQWAEVGFADLGWVTFDPVGLRGARARASRPGIWEAELERLVQNLRADPQPSVRLAATGDLVRYSEKSPLPAARVIKPLAEALRSDYSSSVRSAAAQSLGALGGALIIEPLAEAIVSDAAPGVRISAIQGLTNTERDDAIPGISQALADTDPVVRDTAEDALTELGAEVAALENGGSLVIRNAAVSAVAVAVSAGQAAEPARIPVFEARGSAHTQYFRTTVGDVYQDGVWRSSTAAEIPYRANQGISDLVDRLLPGHIDNNLDMGNPDPQSASLAWPASAFGLQSFKDQITVLSASTEPLPAGSWPISLGTRRISSGGQYRPFSVTFRSDQPRSAYSWSAQTLRPTGDRLTRATLSKDPAFTQLPDNMPARVADLAARIARDHDTPYSKAKAIESYLRNNYSYAFAEPGGAQPPIGQDPVDWFLFDAKEGTCGQFSSAFVVLARAAGIPARVVSGWTVSPQDGPQTVYSDQAHQWAEVPFEGLGWITFEPTAAGGAPGRIPGFEDGSDGATTPDGDSAARALLQAIAADDPDLARAIEQQLGGAGQEVASVADQLRELLEGEPSGDGRNAAELLAQSGAQVTPLENGGSLVKGASGPGWWVPGTTTQQAPQPIDSSPVPVFQVTGGISTAYLRTTSGEVYSGGGWSQIDPVQLEYHQGETLPTLVERKRPHWDLSGSPMAPNATASRLAWPEPGFGELTGLDRIKVSAHPEAGGIPAGRKPVSLRVDQVMTDGSYAPLSATFSSEGSPTEYSWIAQHVEFPQDQLVGATPFTDAAYTQLPPGLPPRIRELALNITSGHDGAYPKAKAIERFLRSNYTYAYATEDTVAPPAGRDPVDWFLFEAKEGTCGQFSSAFVVLARSVGLPARVVSGWAIGATQQSRTVYSNQAHQWAEVPFEGLGWITFEPTAAGGAPFRSSETPGGPVNEAQSPDLPPERQSDAETEQEQSQLPGAQETITEITQWPSVTRLGEPFVVGGIVTTASGGPVDGMEVEIFINEQKENGGIKVGTGVVERGSFAVEVHLPARFARGAYQLIAHAMANSEYEESWSDPEIKVYSGTGLQLAGPTEVAVDTVARFSGQLSEEVADGLADREIRITIDGQPASPAHTDATGRFAFTHTFVETGEHVIGVSFEEADFLVGNEAQLVLNATMPSVLEIPAMPPVRRNEDFSIRGQLQDTRGRPLAGRDVAIALAGSPPLSATTDEGGAFRINGVIPDTGIHELAATFGGDEDEDIEPASYRTSVKVAADASIVVAPLEPARAGELLELEARLLDDQEQGIAGATLSYGEDGSAMTDASGTATLTVAIPDLDEFLLTLKFDGDHSHLPVTYTVALPVMPSGFDWLRWVGLPLAFVLCASLAYIVGRQGLLLGRRRRGEGSSSSDSPAIATAAPVSHGSAPLEATGSAESDGEPAALTEVTDPKPLTATKLAIRFPDLPPGADRSWRLGEPVRAECELISVAGKPLADMNLRLEWADPGEPLLLTTDIEGKCVATWSGSEAGTHRVSARFQGDEHHSPSSASEEFELRGPVPTVLAVNIWKSADDLPDVWGTGETMAVEFLLADLHRQPVAGRHLVVSIGETDQPVEVITDASGRGYADLTGPIPGS